MRVLRDSRGARKDPFANLIREKDKHDKEKKEELAHFYSRKYTMGTHDKEFIRGFFPPPPPSGIIISITSFSASFHFPLRFIINVIMKLSSHRALHKFYEKSGYAVSDDEKSRPFRSANFRSSLKLASLLKTKIR